MLITKKFFLINYNDIKIHNPNKDYISSKLHELALLFGNKITNISEYSYIFMIYCFKIRKKSWNKGLSIMKIQIDNSKYYK